MMAADLPYELTCPVMVKVSKGPYMILVRTCLSVKHPSCYVVLLLLSEQRGGPRMTGWIKAHSISPTSKL